MPPLVYPPSAAPPNSPVVVYRESPSPSPPPPPPPPTPPGRKALTSCLCTLASATFQPWANKSVDLACCSTFRGAHEIATQVPQPAISGQIPSRVRSQMTSKSDYILSCLGMDCINLVVKSCQAIFTAHSRDLGGHLNIQSCQVHCKTLYLHKPLARCLCRCCCGSCTCRKCASTKSCYTG